MVTAIPRRPWRLWIPALLVGLLVAVAASFYFFRPAAPVQQEEIIRTYFRAVVAGRSDEAEQVLTGNALAMFRRTMAARPRLRDSALVDLQISWLVTGKQVAVAEVTAVVHQVEDGGKATDLQAARVHLSRMEGGWRVFAYEPIPLPYGGKAPADTEATAVVDAYMKATAAGRYDEALRFLAGSARNDAESTLAVMKQTKLDMKVSGLQLTVTERSGNAVWVMATYTASVAGNDARPVRLLLEVRGAGGAAAIVKVNNL